MLKPRLRWPLLIYEISISVVNCIEHKISSFLRKWLNIHHSTTNICLHSSTSPCPLPLKSLTSILKSTRVIGHLLLRESADKQISKSASQLKCGFWDVAEAVVDAESRLDFKKLLDTIKHPELALDHLKAHLFLAGILTSIEDIFRTWSVKLMKMHIMLNLCSSICRATGLNGVTL